MIDQQQQYETSHEQLNIKQLYPANPIYEKPVQLEPKISLKVEIIKNQNQAHDILRPIFKKEADEYQQLQNKQYESDQINESAFRKYYGACKKVFQKYPNGEYSQTNGTQYLSSTFIDRKLFANNKNPITNIADLLKQLYSQSRIQQAPQKNQIRFDSNFESGNLFAAYKKTSTEYDLLLQNDINSKGNTQWFYFSVTNLPKDVEFTFNIVNLLKNDSLFNYGMQPVVYSKLRYQQSGEGWERTGKSLSYFKNTIKRQRSKRYYHTLSFKITSKLAHDTLYIAHCYPYTYTMLQDYIEGLLKSPKKSFIKNTIIGKSVGNNNIFMLTLAEPPENRKDNRRIIVILARQHPGESQGSYVCEGMINYLTGKSKQAEFMRKNYIIKIIPMVNPDGVLFGNYRSNLMGFDLNRKWDIYDRDSTFPQVTCIKKLFSELNKQRRIKFVLDLHGHSKKLNSFFYGNPFPQHPEVVRAFPYYCSKINHQISFEDCTFTIEQGKRKAARVYLSTTYQLIHIYTFESSFYGYVKDNKKYNFGIQEYKGLGMSLCEGLFAFLENDFHFANKTIDRSSGVYIKFLTQLKESTNLVMMGNKPESGSETNPEEYQTGVASILYHHDFAIDPNCSTELQSFENSSKSHKYTLSPITKKMSPKPKKKEIEIPRINPSYTNKYELGLQPMSNIIENKIKQEELENKQLILRKSTRQMRYHTQTQTTPISELMWENMKMVSTSYTQSERMEYELKSTSPPQDLKYVSLTTETSNRRGLKLDLVNRPTRKNFIVLKNTYSQTLLSFCLKKQTIHPTLNLPQIEKEAKQRMKYEVSKTTRIENRRQNQDVISQMVRKYLVDMKQKHLRPILSHEEKSFIEKSFPTRIEELNIQKKQIMMQKKHSLSRQY